MPARNTGKNKRRRTDSDTFGGPPECSNYATLPSSPPVRNQRPRYHGGSATGPDTPSFGSLGSSNQLPLPLQPQPPRYHGGSTTGPATSSFGSLGSSSQPPLPLQPQPPPLRYYGGSTTGPATSSFGSLGSSSQLPLPLQPQPPPPRYHGGSTTAPDTSLGSLGSSSQLPLPLQPQPPPPLPLPPPSRAEQSHSLLPPMRIQPSLQTSETQARIDQQLANLPRWEDFERGPRPTLADDTDPHRRTRLPSQPSSSRSTGLQQPGYRPETVLPTGYEYSAGHDVNYVTLLDGTGGVMPPGATRMADEDEKLCKRLLMTKPPVVTEVSVPDYHIEKSLEAVRGQPGASIRLEVPPRLLPLIERLRTWGHVPFMGLVESHKDPSNKPMPFYEPGPQPSHMYGFATSEFEVRQRGKLMSGPTEDEAYEGVYFPFLVAEVGCSTRGFEPAERLNLETMTVQMRGIVDLYRNANRCKDVHRRVLGFSISQKENCARIYAHYPEIKGSETAYWRALVKTLSFQHSRATDIWALHFFTINVCNMFARSFAQRLKQVINRLPDPFSTLYRPAASSFSNNARGSRGHRSVARSDGQDAEKMRRLARKNAQLQRWVLALQEQSASQAEKANEKEALLEAQVDQLRRDMERLRNNVAGLSNS